MESLIDESMDIIPVAAPAAAAATPAEAPAEAPEPRELRRSATATPILSAAANAAITPGAISNAYASCGSTPSSSRRGSGNEFRLDAPSSKASPKTPPRGVAAQRPPMTAPGWIESEGAPAASSSTPSPAAPPSSSLSFGRFVGQQLGWEPDDGAADYDLEDDRRRRGVYNFLQVPWNLEPLLLFGFCTCLDAFVTLYTFLPLRIVAALAGVARGGKLTPDQRCDVLCGLLIVAESALLLRFDVSQWYHYVRIQTMIKLYVVFNVLEIFDKLCASFGQARRRRRRRRLHHHTLTLHLHHLQDILDALFATARKTPSATRKRAVVAAVAVDFAIAFVYISVHTLILLIQSVALNVAVNSNNNVLLTLLVSNNFVELKGSVFKKCEKQNLFQISCAAAAAAAQPGAQFGAILAERPTLPAAGAPTRSSASRCSSTS